MKPLSIMLAIITACTVCNSLLLTAVVFGRISVKTDGKVTIDNYSPIAVTVDQGSSPNNQRHPILVRIER